MRGIVFLCRQVPILCASLMPLGAIYYAGAACAQDAASTTTAADPPASPYTLTGHLDLVSRYVVRGVTSTYGNGTPLGNAGADAPESARPALQWGVDLAHGSGWSIGYWTSMINYSYLQFGRSYSDRSITDFQKDRSIENDFYAAYGGKLVGDLGYTAGMTAYYYINGEHANALESKLGLSYGPLSFNAQTLLNDVVWGNKGDTYWTLVFTQPLSYGAAFTVTAGAYTYRKEGKYLGSTDTLTGTPCGPGAAFAINGCYAGNAPVGKAFRHLTLALTAPIPGTPATVGFQWILGGKNRFGVSQKNQFLTSLSVGF